MNIDMDNSTPFEWNVVTLLGTLMRNVGGVVGAVSQQTEALERIATALEAGHGEEEQAPKLMHGVGLDPDSTQEGDYVRKPSIELHRGLHGYGGVYRDETNASWFAMELDPEFKADDPEDLRDIAAMFRDNYADALEWIADEWQAQLDAGEVQLLEPDSPANDDDNEDDDEEQKA